MNRFLYKYMSLREDFFNNFMIRATPSFALNDPFEGAFNESQVKDLNRNHVEYYKQNGKSPYELDSGEIAGLMGTHYSNINDLGIIALTEDYNNIQMWSHYADDHKGMVVEFDFSEPFFMDSLLDLDGRKSRFGKDYFGEVYEYPQKVDYRREFPSFERPELSNPDSVSEFHWKKFNKTILFTKANDWMYEKEQRIIVPLRDADSIICSDSKLIREICKKENIKFKRLERNRVRITYPHEYEMHEDLGDESIKSEIFRLSKTPSSEQPLYLFRINPLCISGLYFGCKSEITREFYQVKIDNNTHLKHLTNIFKMKVNNSQYQLNPIKFTMDY